MSTEIFTPERSEYVFTQAQKECFNFKVRAPLEAQIALTAKPSETEPIFEVYLGCEFNQKSVIRRDFEIVASADTPDLLNSRRKLGFWIKWQDNRISVGRANEEESFLAYTLPDEEELFEIFYVGIRVGEDCHGYWLLEDGRKCSGPGFWLPASDGNLPQFAMSAGHDASGEKFYIARAEHAGDLLPGQLLPSKKGCYVSYDGKEFSYAKYEVFCNSGGHWETAQGNELPEHAVRCGRTSDGEPLYLGRVTHEDANGSAVVSIGKVQKTHECCYIPYEGGELSFKEFEIFVWKPFGAMEFMR